MDVLLNYIIEQLDLQVMDEQKLRRIIRQVIKEQADPALLREEAGLYSTFITPFVDIVKAGTLATQDVLNSLRLVFDTLTTISPRKKKEARKRYETRREATAAKWAPLMKDISTTLKNSDLGVLMFATNPGAYIGLKLGEEITDAAVQIPEFLDQAGWSVPFAKLIPGYESTEPPEEPPGPIKKILSGIAGLFFIESVDPNLPLILEQKGISRDSLNQINSWLESSGAMSGLSSVAEEMVDAKLDQVKELVAAIDAQGRALRSFVEAENFDQFTQALSAAESAGVDGVDKLSNEVKKMRDDLDNEADRLVKDKDFREKVEGEADRELTDEEVRGAAEKAAQETVKKTFDGLKKNLKDSLSGSQEKMAKELRDEIMEDFPDEGSTEYKLFAASKIGKDLLASIEDAIKKVTGIGEGSE